MYVFYEDDGSFKAGNILSETDASLQVESESGKRSKIKRANTLFTFAAPEPAALMSQAAAAAEALDLQFLWECAPQEEFDSPPWPPIISATPHAGRTGRAADATARRARLFPPPRQGPLSPRPARHPGRRAGRAGEKAASGRAAAGMGR